MHSFSQSTLLCLHFESVFSTCEKIDFIPFDVLYFRTNIKKKVRVEKKIKIEKRTSKDIFFFQKMIKKYTSPNDFIPFLV